MQRDWKGPYQRKLQRIASERGRQRANVRWTRERERRDKLAALEAERNPTRICARIVVILNEREVKEFTCWSFETWRERQRKCRKAEAYALQNDTQRHTKTT